MLHLASRLCAGCYFWEYNTHIQYYCARGFVFALLVEDLPSHEDLKLTCHATLCFGTYCLFWPLRDYFWYPIGCQGCWIPYIHSKYKKLPHVPYGAPNYPRSLSKPNSTTFRTEEKTIQGRTKVQIFQKIWKRNRQPHNTRKLRTKQKIIAQCLASSDRAISDIFRTINCICVRIATTFASTVELVTSS